MCVSVLVYNSRLVLTRYITVVNYDISLCRYQDDVVVQYICIFRRNNFVYARIICLKNISINKKHRYILYCARCVSGIRYANNEKLDYLTTHTSLSPIRRGFAPGFVNYKKGALDSQPQVIKFTSCLPMVGGSLRVLLLLPPINLVAMI